MSWWESAPLAQPAGQPVVDLTDRTKVAADARDEVRTDIAVQGNERDAGATLFNQKRNYRSDFFSLPEVKRYGVIVNQYGGILTAPKSPAGDQARINSFSQMLNPTSTVMLGEYEAAADNQTALQKAQAAIGKELKFDGSGRLLDESRRELALAARKITANANAAYSQQRKFYRQLAERDNIDPFEIIGDHLGKPYDEQDRNFWKDSQPKPVETVNGFAKGTQVELGGGDSGGFNRDTFLETLGLDNKKESVLMAGLNQLSGNPNLTAEDMLSVYEQAGVPLPDPAAFKQQLDYARKGYQFGPIDTTAQEAAYKAKVDEFAQYNDNVTGAIESGLQGVTQGLTFGFGDEIGAGLTTALEGGTYDDNLERERVMRDGYRQANPIASYGSEVLSSAAIPMGVAKSPIDLARIGAASGALYGMGSSDGDIGDRIISGGVGAGIGAVAAPAMGGLVSVAAPAIGRMMRRAPGVADDLPPEMSAPEFIAAAQRRDIDYLPADIPGSNATQIATAITDKTFGSKFIQDGAQKSVNSVQNAVGHTTDNLGGAGDNVAAGQAAQRGANAWQDAADAKIGDLYDKIPIAPESVAETTNTLSALRSVNNPLNSNPALSAEISDPKLKAYQNALENGGLSWEDLKGFRSYVGGKLGAPTLQNDIPKDRLKAIYAGLSSDLEATASKQGPQALAAFKRANTYKRAVETRRENVMGMLLGKKLDMSPEKTFAQLQSWAKAKGGDFAKLSQAVRSLPQDEANAVRATIIDTLGKATDGAQNSTGTAFSPSTFATRWNQLSPRAKAVLFQGEHRAALDDIAGLSSAMKRADKYNNNSNTGVVVGGAATAGSFLGSPLLTTGVIGGQLLSGVILGSPRVAKWAAALYRKPNQPSRLAHIARLENIAKAEPVIANEVLQLQSALRDAFQQYPERLAAQPPSQEKGVEQQASQRTTGEPQ